MVFKAIKSSKKTKGKIKVNKKEEALYLVLYEEGDKVKINPLYRKAYLGEDILIKTLTVDRHFINEAANIPVMYLKDYPEVPFAGHHFIKA